MTLPVELLVHILAFLTDDKHKFRLRLLCREMDVACLRACTCVTIGKSRGAFSDRVLSQKSPYLSSIEIAGESVSEHCQHWKNKNITFVDCTFCATTNIFQDVQSVCIKDPTGLEDISGLAGVPEVSLRLCNDVRDISCLASCRKVSLAFCHSIADVSALATVECVSIEACKRVVDVSTLQNVRCLELLYCDNINDLSLIGGHRAFSLHILQEHLISSMDWTRLAKCEECFVPYLSQRDLDCVFKNIRVLRLNWCDASDISALSNCRSLKAVEMCYNDRLQDVSPLRHVPVVVLQFCRSLRDVSALANVTALMLSHCNSLEDVSSLGNVRCLTLRRCDNIRCVSGLGKNDMLILNDCRSISDVSMLGNVRVLSLESCENVRDVSALGRVSQLYLGYSGAERFQDQSMQCLDRVEILALTEDTFDAMTPNHRGRRVVLKERFFRTDLSFKRLCRRYGGLDIQFETLL